MSRAARRAALRWGRMGEHLACAVLMLRGWHILHRNYAAHGGEIDIIARRGRIIAFVEVKARADYSQAESAIDSLKLQRLGRAASHWLGRNGWAVVHTLRVDAVDIVPWRLPRQRTDIAPLDIGH